MILFRRLDIILILAVLSINGLAQSERKYIRRGNDAFDEQAYTQSEINYRKAVEHSPGSYKAIFNMGDALYKQGKYQDAAKKFSSLANRDLSDQKLASAYHNLGNALLQSDQLKESIEAYKNALKLNPGDIETKHNLTYALRKLKQQQQQKNKNQNNQNQNQNNQNKQNQNQNKKNQDQQNQQNQQNKPDQDKQERQQPQKDRISKKDAQRLLQALENDEKELQKKLKKKKAKAKSSQSTKDW